MYITGIVMGNSPIPRRRALVHFFDGITGLMQVAIFFLLGLVSTPSDLLQYAGPGLAIALFISFVARPLVVFGILKPFHAPVRQRLLVDWCGLRGASAIVFSIMAALQAGTNNTLNDSLFHTVFFIVLFSILIQGTLLPWITKRLSMLDDL